MEISWYIKYPPQSLGNIKLISGHALRVKDLSWYLDNEVHIDIYEDLLPSPISGYSQYDLDPFALFNKLYYVLHKVIMYADARIFIRDYLTAFTVTDFIHPEIEEKIFFLQSLKKIILYFEEELWIPAAIIKTIDLLIADLLFIADNEESSLQEAKSEEPYGEGNPDEYLSSLKNIKPERRPSPIEYARENAKKIEFAKKTIEGHFNALCPDTSWEYAFRSETDKATIVGLLVLFFTGEDQIEFPAEKVQLRLKTKTKVAKSIKFMYEDLGRGELKKETVLFQIMSCMDSFSNQDNEAIYKLMSK